MTEIQIHSNLSLFSKLLFFHHLVKMNCLLEVVDNTQRPKWQEVFQVEAMKEEKVTILFLFMKNGIIRAVLAEFEDELRIWMGHSISAIEKILKQ